ncbi:hypothetical protein scyTo_0010694 [Scyliorhinus torazame]|uniref:TIMELESS-interacting protein n=1 Tax=Scyliorhinus torazame TaxID=75743 RepID=A0A401PAD3_SCYTO|nr:hypothetical protein [Scyliorhinus torazame]
MAVVLIGRAVRGFLAAGRTFQSAHRSCDWWTGPAAVMSGTLDNIPDYDHLEDEIFPPLPPPTSPGQVGDGEAFGADAEEGRQDGTQSKEPVVLRKSDDVKTLLWHMEHWAHRLYPKLQFEDFIDKVEALGGKKEVQTCLKKIRLDIPITHDDFISNEVVENEDGLQIDNLETSFNSMPDQPVAESTPSSSTLSEEQQFRIERNKQLALQRRARLQSANQTPSSDRTDSPTLSQSTAPNQTIVSRDPNDTAEDPNPEVSEATKTEPYKLVQELKTPTEIDLAPETLEYLPESDSAQSAHESENTGSKLVPEATPSQDLSIERITEKAEVSQLVQELESTTGID